MFEEKDLKCITQSQQIQVFGSTRAEISYVERLMCLPANDETCVSSFGCA